MNIKAAPIHSLLALLACFCGRLVTNGSIYCLGVYYNEIRDAFGKSHFETSLLFSLPSAMLQGVGLIVGYLLKKFTERQIVMAGGLIATLSILMAVWATDFYTLLVTLGLLNGIGQGLVYVAVPVAGSYLFAHKHHHIAIALQNTGDGVGFFAFPILYEYLIEVYGWRSSLFIMAGITLQMGVCGALLNAPNMHNHKSNALQFPQPKSSIDDGYKHNSHNVSLWKSCTIYLLLANAFCHSVGFCIFFAFVYAHLTSGLDIAQRTSAWIVTCFGIASIFARLGTVLLNNKPYLRRWAVFGVAHFVEGFCMVAFACTPASHIWLLVLFMCIIGIASGFIGALVCCVAMDLIGPIRLAETFGFMMTFWGLGSLAGAPIGGMIRDHFDSYSLAIIVAGIVDAVGCFCLLPLLWTKGKYFKQIYKPNEDVLFENELAARKHLQFTDPVRGSLIELYGGSNSRLNES